MLLTADERSLTRHARLTRLNSCRASAEQDAHAAGSGSRGGRGRGGAAAAEDAPGSSKAEREKARRERLNERWALVRPVM